MTITLNSPREKLYTYASDSVKLKRKDNPGAWVEVGKANGKMFRSYPLFSFVPGTQGDAEPVRYGDFVIDIDTGELACSAAIKITDWFQEIYAVEPDQWRVYLSGKKGVHLELPAEILGLNGGHILLPLAYKRLAKDIEGELGLKLDLSMYNRGTGKPYRQPNIMRDCGTCKRQIEYDTLYEIESEEDYKTACCKPGETWDSEDKARNELLADKMAHYIAESETQQVNLKSIPQLSNDEIDRLSINVPLCIHTLANATDPGKTSNTFNDVAIQLTAYANTAGFSESRFLTGCKSFIENYPSTSLNTAAKRYDNCIARFRTMAANGYQHSCGGVKALGFPGYDCKKCKAMPNGPASTVEVMSSEDIDAKNMTLDIPAHVLRPGGLIDLGIDGLSAKGLPAIDQYSFPVIIAAMARTLSGKITCQQVWPNLFNIKVGPTSSGKSVADKEIKREMTRAGFQNFCTMTDIASGPALYRGLEKNPQSLIMIDEITSIFRRYNKSDPIADAKRDALLEIYSASGEDIVKEYGNSKNSISIQNVCLTLTGNATPVILDTITIEDFHTGFIPRVDFFTYDGKIPYKGVRETGNLKLEQFAAGVKNLFDVEVVAGNLQAVLGYPVDIELTANAAKLLAEHSHAIIDQNNNSDDNIRGIISRAYDLAIKYALIHIGSTRPPTLITDPMTDKDLQWGIAVAKVLTDWKIGVLQGKIVSGDFHKDCEIFKEAIKGALRMGQRPTFKTMANRRIKLKDWKRQYSSEVIEILVKRGEIALDESGKKTVYHLVKE